MFDITNEINFDEFPSPNPVFFQWCSTSAVQSWFRSMYLFYIFLNRFSMLITFLLQQIWHGKVNDILIIQDAEAMQKWKIGLKLAIGVKITEVNRFFFSKWFEITLFKKKNNSMISPQSWATVSSHSREFLMHSFLRTFLHSFLHNNNTDWTFAIIKRLIQLLFVAITIQIVSWKTLCLRMRIRKYVVLFRNVYTIHGNKGFISCLIPGIRRFECK